MTRDPLFILTVLSVLVLASEHLARRAGFRHLGAALLVILLGAAASNGGLIPAGSTPDAPVPIYDVIFSHVAAIGLFWLLLHVNLRSVARAGLPIVALFFAGAAGTMIGATLGAWAAGGRGVLGPFAGPIAGMFTGTYIGGGINFNAIALHYGVMREGALFVGATVVDNVVTTVWIAVTLALPRVLAPFWRRRSGTSAAAAAAPIVELVEEQETLNPMRLAAALALGGAALWVSMLLAGAAARAGVAIPMILIITVLALALAQVGGINRMPGPRVLGMFAVYLFLAVVGVFCDVRALAGLGRIGVPLAALAATAVAVHGIVIFGVAWLLRMDLAAAAVASQANVGGSTTALALAKSLGREDLLLPGILLGALGNAVGTFAGFVVAQLL